MEELAGAEETVEGSSASRMPLEESIRDPIRSGGGCGEEADVARRAPDEQPVELTPAPEFEAEDNAAVEDAPVLLNICSGMARWW